MDNNKKIFIITIISSIIVSSIFGGIMGFFSASLSTENFNLFAKKTTPQNAAQRQLNIVEEESAVIQVAEQVSPAVVSIIVTKDLPKIRNFRSMPFGHDFFNDFFGGNFNDFFGSGVQQFDKGETEKREVGGGTGFIVSEDGFIVTNKHVVLDEDAEYTVLMNDESRHEAKVLARDLIQDIAILKIDVDGLTTVELGNSDDLKVGQSVVAIGNALGEFRNTVSTGVISGLSRSITASGAGIGRERLVGTIQTDASINPGNSGGPLLNLAGQVIGVNTAIAQGAQNIGFAIPVNEIKNIYESVKKHGKIIRPWLGVRYIQLNQKISEANNLEIDYGALVVRGEQRTDLAVVPGSPADKAGIEENDIILEINNEKLIEDNPLALVIRKFQPGDEITLKILHKGEEKQIKATLTEMKSN